MATKKKNPSVLDKKAKLTRAKVAEEIRGLKRLAKGTTEEIEAFNTEVEKTVQSAMTKIL